MRRLTFTEQKQARILYANVLGNLEDFKKKYSAGNGTTQQIDELKDIRKELFDYLGKFDITSGVGDAVIHAAIFSDTQVRFIEDCEKEGVEWYMYSGRSMFGDYCPAITTDSPTDNPSRVKTKWDNMGLRYVIYCDK